MMSVLALVLGKIKGLSTRTHYRVPDARALLIIVYKRYLNIFLTIFLFIVFSSISKNSVNRTIIL